VPRRSLHCARIVRENLEVFSELFRHSPAARPPLKVGLLLDGMMLKKCFVSVLEDIRLSNFAVLDCAVIQRPSVPPTTFKRSPLQAASARLTNRKLRNQLLYDLYTRWVSSHTPEAYALTEVDCTPQLKDVEIITVEPITTGFVQRFPDTALEEIRRRDLDVLLRFGFNILRGDILHAARYGVWSFHHGDNEYYRGGPALFWELWEGNPLSGVILQRLTEELDAGIVLSKSIFATAQTLSVAENRHGPYTATTHFIIRKLQELHRFGYAELEARRVADSPYRGRRRLYRTPTNAEMLRFGYERVRARARRVLQPAKLRHWKIGIRKGGPFIDAAALRGDAIDTTGFTWIDSPPGKYYADPFLMEHDGRTWLFVEEFDHSEGKGCIAVAELDDKGRPAEFVRCLDLPYHLSFPFVFSHQGEVWLIPEAAASHEVVLYRATNFPFDWTADRVLLRGDYVDTVVWREDLWWMLTTVREPPGYSVHTLLFSASNLGGEWQLHPASPLFSDVRCARNGGAIIQRSGRHFRVSQDCSVEYGRAFEIHEITSLTDTTYSEQRIARLEPNFLPNMIATHTYNRAGDIEVIDGCFLEPARRLGHG
jgi:hypothetical protein